ncbi:hypothetical protein B0G69_3873 [Paraburkholderia sp. RAU2J]|nr:hypothetical protein B0G69_3873 [Paraburkholderia sp. RAU2J]
MPRLARRRRAAGVGPEPASTGKLRRVGNRSRTDVRQYGDRQRRTAQGTNDTRPGGREGKRGRPRRSARGHAAGCSGDRSAYADGSRASSIWRNGARRLAKVRVFGTCDSERRSASKGDAGQTWFTHLRGELHKNAKRNGPARNLGHNVRENPSHSLGTPASKGWRGFWKDMGKHPEAFAAAGAARCVTRQNLAHRSNGP